MVYIPLMPTSFLKDYADEPLETYTSNMYIINKHVSLRGQFPPKSMNQS